jgi:archaellum component FlaG (FlaF/FlaG flagellin family)
MSPDHPRNEGDENLMQVRMERSALLSAGVVAILAAGALAAAAGASSNHGVVGSTVTVKGQGKDMIAVTVGKIEDPLLAYGADPGKRVIGINVTVKNVGKVKYSDSPSAFVSTQDGEISTSLITGSGPCNTPGTLKLTPGQQKSICLPFEIEKSGKLAFIQYNVDSGYGTPAVFAVK